MMQKYVADAQSSSDVALQLPTGSGKTLVGLLIGEWLRRKNQERVVFLCPTRQLVNQVVQQAEQQYASMFMASSDRNAISTQRLKPTTRPSKNRRHDLQCAVQHCTVL